MNRPGALLRIGVLAALAGCGPQRTRDVVPQLIAPPALLDFGQVPVLNPKVVEVPLHNVGRASLNVISAVIKESSVPFSVAVTPPTVEAGGTGAVRVVFLPPLEQGYSATLEVASDDPALPLVDVKLTGTGFTRAVMQVDPPLLDFGRVPEGTSALKAITVSSRGSADLLLTQINFTDGGPGFSFLGSVSTPATVKTSADGGAGGQIQLTVRYTAAAGTTTRSSSQVHLQGSDPAYRDAYVQLSADVDRAPIPVIKPLGPGAPGMTIALDGTGSSDPDNDVPLTFRWTLASKSLGSATTIDQPTQAQTQMTLDPSLPGEYVVQLDVTDSTGTRNVAPARASVVATPAEKLLVEMFQDNAATDLDLHFLKSPSVTLDTAPNDCFYANPTPIWSADGGVDGGGTGPRYLRDAITGYGPEVTGYADPLNTTYRVVVEYANAHLSTTPSTGATVRFFLFGVEKAEFNHTLLQQGDVWQVADIEWPSGKITPLP